MHICNERRCSRHHGRALHLRQVVVQVAHPMRIAARALASVGFVVHRLPERWSGLGASDFMGRGCLSAAHCRVSPCRRFLGHDLRSAGMLRCSTSEHASHHGGRPRSFADKGCGRCNQRRIGPEDLSGPSQPLSGIGHRGTSSRRCCLLSALEGTSRSGRPQSRCWGHSSWWRKCAVWLATRSAQVGADPRNTERVPAGAPQNCAHGTPYVR